ncbi:MAG: hypothetical protein WBP42_05115 [Candidatus Zixiibacteriota bacterium]
MRFRKHISRVGMFAAAVVALFVFSGCSSNSAGPDDQIPPDDKINYLYDTGRADDVSKVPSLLEVTEVFVEEIVSLLGGTIDVVVDDATATFDVPFGAILSPTNITIDVKKFDTPLGSLYVYDCGPDGTKFKLPAKLSVPMPSGQGYSYLYYYNEETETWDLQEVVKVKDGVATFKIKHFSKYGIS